VIEGCRIADKGADEIWIGLMNNKTLKGLIISDNKISNVKLLRDTLKVNKSLRKLDICGNEINTEGIRYIIEGLTDNNTIDDLEFCITL